MNQFEENLKLSFGYVKKDLLKMSEQMEALNEKIQHIALNHASLLGELSRLERDLKEVKGQNKAKKKAAKKSTKKKSKSARKPVKRVVKETVTYE